MRPRPSETRPGALARGLAGLLAPPLCVACRSACDPARPLCGACVRELNAGPALRGSPPAGIVGIASCAPHDGVARRVLAAYKFRGMTGLADLIAGFMADLAGPAAPGTVVVPVPAGRLRRRLRGFDPVAPLAGRVAAALPGAEPGEGALARRDLGRQRGRGRAGRLAAPPRIVAPPGRLPPGRPVLLVDDVTTTGATLAAAAAALRAAGAGPVRAVTFTRRP